MANLSDPGEITPPADPAPAESASLFTPVFWTAISVGIVCMIAGVLLTLFVPRLWRKPPAPTPPIAAAPTVPAPSLPQPAGPDASESPAEASPPPAGLGVLDNRLRAVEQAQARIAQAGVEAIAVSALS